MFTFRDLDDAVVMVLVLKVVVLFEVELGAVGAIKNAFFYIFIPAVCAFFNFFIGDKTTQLGGLCFDTELLWGYMIRNKGFLW